MKNTTHADKLQKKHNFYYTEKPILFFIESDSANGKLVVKGLELKSYLSRLITFPPTGQSLHRVNSNVETIMKEYVTAQLTRKI